MTTKILALTDALGNLVRFELMPGHRFDMVGVAPLIEGIRFGGLIADKAFDSNHIIADLNERGAKIVISQHPRRAKPLPLDKELYKWRHLIENFFCKLKEFKRIATCACKTDQSFEAMIYLVAAVIIHDESPQTLEHAAFNQMQDTRSKFLWLHRAESRFPLFRTMLYPSPFSILTLCHHKKSPGSLRGHFSQCGEDQAVARRAILPSLSPAIRIIAFCSFSKARTSIWRTRSRDTP